MKILNTSGTLGTKQVYDMTQAPNIGKMRDVVGQTLEIAGFVVYETETREGEIKKVLSVLTVEGEVFATNSRTFIEDFENILEITGGEFRKIQAVEGISRAGRKFIQCLWVD